MIAEQRNGRFLEPGYLIFVLVSGKCRFKTSFPYPLDLMGLVCKIGNVMGLVACLDTLCAAAFLEAFAKVDHHGPADRLCIIRRIKRNALHCAEGFAR